MAADQWRKRLNSANIVACNGREQYRAKRKNSGLSQYDSNMRSHISLEWDGNQKRVVARREQVGISWRDMRPFVASSASPSVNNIVADVFAVPREIYGLENLEEVLLYEFWESYLSESEKHQLLQFLPRGLETEQVVQSLLAGDNFHFGNPFLNWGSSVCSGDHHPDAIRQKDQHLKTEKKAYFAELHKYHNNMIVNLLKLKESFEQCKDPEGEIVQKTWRLGTETDKKISSSANNSRFHLLEDNVDASSESCSSDADEKPCSSDNQNPSTVKAGERQTRVCKKGSLKDNIGNPSSVSGDVNLGAKSRKGDKRQQQDISFNDGAKYMSCVKISKKQHEIVKNMKQSGKSILSRSLNRVLGNIDSFNVQPYEVFIEEEQKKLRDHWIKLANKALPAAYANWRDLNLQRQQLRKSLEQDINERLRKVTEDVEDTDSHNTIPQDHQIENVVDDHICTVEGEDKSLCGSPQRDSQEDFSSGKEFDSMDIDSEKQVITAKSDDATMNASEPTEYSGSTNGGDAEIVQEVHLSCGGDVWPTSNISHSFYDSTVSPEYACGDDGLTIVPPKRSGEDQQVQLVDLESDLQVGDSSEKDMVHRQAEEDGSFGSYSNQGRNELFQIQSLFKGEDEMLMYDHHEQKQTGLDMLMEDGQFPGHGHFQEESPHPPLPPVERGQKRDNENVYIQQNISDNVYSEGGRFLMPRQEGLSGVDVQDWSVNSVRMQPHLNGELTSWWSRGSGPGPGPGVPAQTIASRNSGGDQSLYSVLSQSNQLRSSSPYQSVGSSTEQFIPSRSYGVVLGGSAITNQSMGNVPLQATHHALDYMSGHEASPALIADDMGWMGLPPHQHHQNNDPMGKPFLRSWNQRGQ